MGAIEIYGRTVHSARKLAELRSQFIQFYLFCGTTWYSVWLWTEISSTFYDCRSTICKRDLDEIFVRLGKCRNFIARQFSNYYWNGAASMKILEIVFFRIDRRQSLKMSISPHFLSTEFKWAQNSLFRTYKKVQNFSSTVESAIKIMATLPTFFQKILFQ